MIRSFYLIRIKRNLLLFLIIVIFMTAFSTTAFAKVPVGRIAGLDRYETSIEISKSGWSQSDYVLLATGEDFPDSLSAAPLAKKYNAPILLTSKYSISAELQAELSRLKVKHAFVLGGTGVISEDVSGQLQKLGINVERLAGADRYETSVRIAEKVGTSDEIAVADGENFGDALSISSIAASKNIPVILVPGNYLNDSISNYIRNRNIYKTYIIGDSSIISNSVAEQFQNPERITGTDKYDRNVNIINRFSDEIDFGSVYLATGNDFPDSLSGSALAAKTNSPIVLVNKFDTTRVKDLLRNKNTSILKILGGEAVVNGSVAEEIASSVGVNTSPVSNSSGGNNSMEEGKPVKLFEEFEPFKTDKNVSGENVTISGNSYTAYNIMDNNVYWNLDGNYSRLTFSIGCLDNKDHAGPIIIYGDDKKVGESEILYHSNGLKNYSVDISGVKILRIYGNFGSGYWLFGNDAFNPLINPTITQVSGIPEKINIDTTPGAMTVSSSKPEYTTEEDILLNWTTSENAVRYGLTIRKAPYEGDANIVYNAANHTGNSANVGKLPEGSYRFAMRGYSSSGKGGAVSNIVYFTVVKDTTSKGVIFPVDINTGSWYGITYGGTATSKGDHWGTSYRAVDLNLPNNNDKGKTVKAVADGKVVKVLTSYGQVNIKHTVALTLSDGSRTYKTWYTVYAHMSNITVKEGDDVKQGKEIGKISKINATSEHLHFVITTKLTDTNNVSREEKYNSYTLSPLWLGGDYEKIEYRPYSSDQYDKNAVLRLKEPTSKAPASN